MLDVRFSTNETNELEKVEPFAGSLAVLLARPASHKHKLWSRTDVERIQPRPESFLFEAGGNLFYDRHALKKTPLQAPD
jgi:hypothetical protein